MRVLSRLRHYNRRMGTARLDRVLEQLALYDHPLLAFSARDLGDAVEVTIRFKEPPVPVHIYTFSVHPRDLDSPRFGWQFQRLLYDCLHDYLVEMFTRTPQSDENREPR